MTGPFRGPVAHPDSPAPAPGLHNLSIRRGLPVRVAIDTSTFFAGSFRLPLVASAQSGDLAVYWSPVIAREIAKVSYREGLLAAFRSLAHRQDPSLVSTLIRQTCDQVAENLDAQLTACERVFNVSPNLDAIDEALLAVVDDPADRPVLRAALAAECRYILSLDQRHFAHGTAFHGVQCWHPDTFLTLFYQQNPDAYERAIRSIGHLSNAIRRRLLP